MTAGSVKKLRVALIGGGRMALQHAKAIQVQPNADLISVVDPYISMHELGARFDRSIRCYDDLEEMLSSEAPDVVHVVTPPDSHAALARVAMKYGAHVYVEKPFALGLEEATTLLSEAAEKGLKLCAAHQVLFQDTGYRLRDSLHLVGEPVHIESYFSFRQVRTAGRGKIGPVDQLIDVLPHPVYLLLSVLTHGQPEDVIVELRALEVSEKGEVRAIVQCGARTSILIVSLSARPIESYLKVVGKNGSLLSDFVLSGLTRLPGPGFSAPSVVLRPFQQAIQLVGHTTVNLFKMLFRKHKSYPGLAELLGEFYASILQDTDPPVSQRSILDTVSLCEKIGLELHARQRQAEQNATERLIEGARSLPLYDESKGLAFVTGGSGFLGRAVTAELRRCGYRVRALSRHQLAPTDMLPGIEYVKGDLADGLPGSCLDDVSLVVHLAAETAGTRSDHLRNTVDATRNLLDVMAGRSVRGLILAGSIAVLKPPRSARTVLTESSEVDFGNPDRGPYVEAKAEQERIVADLARTRGLDIRTIRLGPLVDFDSLDPPGRLGREVGPLFVAAGIPSSRVNVCDVRSAARVVRYVADNFENADGLLNLIEEPAPTRGQLLKLVRERRPDLRVFWLPFPLLKGLQLMLNGVSTLSLGKIPRIELYAAFASQAYDASLAQRYLQAANSEGRT